MNILDLDLDFFQNGRITSNDPTSKELTSAWTAEDVRNYLEKKLHLNKANKIKGKIFTNHDKAFSFWEELIKKGYLTKPFNVYHVDAHSDFGYMGKWWMNFFNKYVDEYFFSYKDFPTYELNQGNFMCYALANRWFNEVNYIYNDTDSTFDGDDIFPLLLKDGDIDSNTLQICLFRDKISPSDFCGMPELLEKRFMYGLPIPLNRYKGSSFNQSINYDYVSLAVSPYFIVDKSYGNIDIIREYIELI